MNLGHKIVISSVEKSNLLMLNLFTLESQEMKKHLRKKVPNLPQAVIGVAVKDTTIKYALLKMLLVIHAKTEDTLKCLSQLCIANKETM